MNKNETQHFLFRELKGVGFVSLKSRDCCGFSLLQKFIKNISIFDFFINISALRIFCIGEANKGFLFFNGTAFPRQNPGRVCCGSLNNTMEERV
ncbi:MAG: hypothetical protein ACP5MG_03130 [Verrucomicrobiia bacterium]|jgi:hypothetical protein